MKKIFFTCFLIVFYACSKDKKQDSRLDLDKALLVIAVDSGVSMLSIVNDNGFWLVSKSLRINEKETFKSWTIMTTILSFVGFTSVRIISFLF